MMTFFRSLRRAWPLLPTLLLGHLAARAQNVGIGTTTPTQKLDVDGNLRVRGLSGSDTRLPVVLPDGTLGVNAPVFATNPAGPALLSTTPTAVKPQSVAVSGTTAYVVSYTGNSLQAFDVSNPASPTLLSTTPTGSYPQRVVVSGTTAYVINLGGNSLQAFDVSNPASPTLLSTTPTDTAPYGLTVSGTTAYVVNYVGNSLQAFNVSNPASPVLLSTTPTGNSPRSVAVSGTTAYVANRNSGNMQAFNVRNPASPVLLSTTPTGNTPQTVVVSGTTAYVINQGSSNFQAYNVANPATPTLLSTTPTGYNPESLVVNGTMLYLVKTGNASYTLQAFSVANPANPVLLSTNITGMNPNSLAVSGSLVYVANYSSNTLQVFSLPAAPRIVAVNANGSLASVPQPSGDDFILNTTNQQDNSSFNVSGSGTVGGQLKAGSAQITGLATAGFVSTDAAGNLSSSGSSSASFIQNGTSPQAGSNFNVSGSGTVGGNLTAGSATVGGDLAAGSATVGGDLIADARGANTGSTASMLRLGGSNSGEGLGSKRSTGGNQYGLDFYTASLNRLSIDVSGNVGIGTTAPGQKLDVRGNANVSGDVAVGGNLRRAVRLCPVNYYPVGVYTLTAADLAFDVFKVANNSYASVLVLPASGAGQVVGQELTIYSTASTSFTISGTNTDNTANVTVQAQGTAGLHAAKYLWDGIWIRVQ